MIWRIVRLALVVSLSLHGLWSSVLLGQSASTRDAVLDVLVFGTHVPIDPQAYTGELRVEVDRFLRRAQAYRSTTTPPAIGEGKMVLAAQVGYERRLVAVSDNSGAAALAMAYVKDLRPCYEWEGFHDCPEREAKFADQYQAAHPNGPFSAYLPLLASHRWLCAAEGYEYEKQPADAQRSRRLYQERLLVARASKVLLIRTAAERLAERGRCNPTR